MTNSEQRENEATTELLDVSSEVGQAALTVMTAENISEQIPVLKLGVAAFKIARSVRDHILMNKIAVFFKGPLSSVPAAKRQEMVQRLNDDPDFRQDVGEHLVELLDRIDGYRKPAMLSAVFAAYAKGVIPRSLFSRLNIAIERLPAIDIDNLRRVWMVSNGEITQVADADHELEPEASQALVSANLVVTGSGYGGSAYRLSKTGMSFLELELDRVVPSR